VENKAMIKKPYSLLLLVVRLSVNIVQNQTWYYNWRWASENIIETQINMNFSPIRQKILKKVRCTKLTETEY